MRPESASTTLRRDLSAVAHEFDDQAAEKKFVAPLLAPFAEVGECAATYPVWNRESFKKKADVVRGPDGSYNRITGEFGSANYACEDHGLEMPLDARRQAQYRTFLDLEEGATRILRRNILMAWETRVAALWSGMGLTGHNVTTAWSDAANCVPLTADLPTAFDTLEDKCGCDRSELTIVIPRADYAELVATTEVRDRIKYTFPGVQPALLGAAQLAAMLEVRRVIVPRAAYDSAAEGESESMSQFWAAGTIYVALLCDPDDPIEFPSAARTLLWPGDGATEIPVVEEYWEDRVRAQVLRVRDDTDEVATAEADLMAYSISNT